MISNRRALTLAAFVLALLTVILIASRVRRFVIVDACLDAGGAYDYHRNQCVGARPR